MAKELYLYSPIYDYVAEYLISQMEENRTQDIVLRGNTPGGSVFSGWGIIAKMTEHEPDVLMKVDGHVASMGTYCLIFAKRAEALDVSRIHLHRADGYVNSPEDQEFLDGVNKDLKSKLKKKINAAKFKEITGYTIDDLFDPNTRVEVWLTGKEAKEVGLIQKVNRVEPAEILAMNHRFEIAAELQESEIESFRSSRFKPAAQDKPNPQPTNKVMTLEELKAKHPDIYAQIIALGVTQGVTQERERITAWMPWLDLDAKMVTDSIKEGKTITMANISEFSAKKLSAVSLDKVKASNAPDVTTTEAKEEDAGKTDKEKADAKELSTLEAQVRKNYKLDKDQK